MRRGRLAAVEIGSRAKAAVEGAERSGKGGMEKVWGNLSCEGALVNFYQLCKCSQGCLRKKKRTLRSRRPPTFPAPGFRGWRV